MSKKTIVRLLAFISFVLLLYGVNVKNLELLSYAGVFNFGLCGMNMGSFRWVWLSFVLGNISMLAYTDYKGMDWISNPSNWAETTVLGWLALSIVLVVLAWSISKEEYKTINS